MGLLDVLRKFRRIFTRGQKKGLLALLAGLACCSILDSLVVALMAPFMLLLLNPDAVYGHPNILMIFRLLSCPTPRQFLAVFAVGIAAIFLLRGLLRFGLQRRQAKLIGRYNAELSRALFEKVILQPYRYHTTHSSAQLQHLLVVQVAKLFALLDSLMSAFSALTVGVCIVAVLLSTNWAVTLALVALLSAMLLVIHRYIRQNVKHSAGEYNAAYTGAIKWVYQALGAVKETIVKNRRGFFVQRYAEFSGHTADAHSRYMTWQAIPKLVIETFSMAVFFSLAALLIGLGGDTQSYLPLFATFALAATRLIPLFQQTASALNAVTFYQPAVAAVHDICAGNGLCGPGKPTPEKPEQEHPRLLTSVELLNVGFSFDDAPAPLLEKASLTVRRGESVALVGPSGSGKTTLIDIILGLYAPGEGQVLADGIDIHQNPAWWATMVGYISQTISLCDGSIRLNVALGIPEELIDDGRVRQCLERAQLRAFVESLPEGLDTRVGENGVRLSQGQRQRVAIARALYDDPDVLVMDEATSALDTPTEEAVIDALNALAGEKTLIIVAHRLTTIRRCDRVYRVEDGHVRRER